MLQTHSQIVVALCVRPLLLSSCSSHPWVLFLGFLFPGICSRLLGVVARAFHGVCSCVAVGFPNPTCGAPAAASPRRTGGILLSWWDLAGSTRVNLLLELLCACPPNTSCISCASQPALPHPPAEALAFVILWQASCLFLLLILRQEAFPV